MLQKYIGLHLRLLCLELIIFALSRKTAEKRRYDQCICIFILANNFY